jgi:hypothetical protein
MKVQPHHRCDELDPITRQTSPTELVNRLTEQICMVMNDSIRYELETIATFIDLKFEEMQEIINYYAPQW